MKKCLICLYTFKCFIPLGYKCSINHYCACTCELACFQYLDPADCLLGLHHAYVLGGVPLRQQLGRAQVVSSKDNAINQVFWLTGTWD